MPDRSLNRRRAPAPDNRWAAPRVFICAAMAALRVIEVLYSRRNAREARDAGEIDEGVWSRRTYPLVVVLHATVLFWTLVRGDRRPQRLAAALLLAAQLLRLWVFLTLRSRWICGGGVPRQLVVETGGPYAFLRHPNYTVVLAEVVLLPLAFGLRSFAAAVALFAGGLFAIRIREEEELLLRRPEYAAHFRDKKRLVPGLW